MLIHLIKKDILLVSKYLIIMLAVVILFPFFILWSNSEYTFLGFMLPAVFAVFMPLQCILMKEYKYKKASAYLCSTPYSREYTVISKYLLCFALYVICCLIYFIETLIVPKLGNIDIELLAFTLLVMVVVCGLFLPLYYKLGYVKVKYFFSLLIVASPFLMSLTVKHIGSNASAFFQTNTWFVWVILLVSILLYGFSALISVMIYKKSDL